MTNNFTFFWNNKSPFSNWYPSVFTHNGVEYSCGEQYMMHAKALMFGDTATAEKIMATKVPYEQKRLGRQVANYDEAVWAANRLQTVVEGLTSKFDQNDSIKQILLDTGDQELVEASPFDRVWGIGMSEEDPCSQYRDLWRGENLLGIALMQVRDELRSRISSQP